MKSLERFSSLPIHAYIIYNYKKIYLTYDWNYTAIFVALFSLKIYARLYSRQRISNIRWHALFLNMLHLTAPEN